MVRTEFDKLIAEIKQCKKCEQVDKKGKVICRGSLPCDLLIIGEAPGKSEVVQGKPFVGRAGTFLQIVLDKVKKELELDVKILMTNAMFCRPITKGLDNRTPSRIELFNCQYYVNRLIQLAKPKVILCLGNVSKGIYYKNNDRYFTTYHPAYLIRRGSFSSPEYPSFTRTLIRAIIKANGGEL